MRFQKWRATSPLSASLPSNVFRTNLKKSTSETGLTVLLQPRSEKQDTKTKYSMWSTNYSITVYPFRNRPRFANEKLTIWFRSCMLQEPTTTSFPSPLHVEHQAREASSKLPWTWPSHTWPLRGSNQKTTLLDGFCEWSRLSLALFRFEPIFTINWRRQTVALPLQSLRNLERLLMSLDFSGKYIRNDVLEQVLLLSPLNFSPLHPFLAPECGLSTNWSMQGRRKAAWIVLDSGLGRS